MTEVSPRNDKGQFLPGTVPNPDGYNGYMSPTTSIKQMLGMTVEELNTFIEDGRKDLKTIRSGELLAAKLVNKAANLDPGEDPRTFLEFAKEIINRADGTPKQTIQGSILPIEGITLEDRTKVLPQKTNGELTE